MHSMTNSGMNLSVMPGNQVSLRWAVGNSRQGPEPRGGVSVLPNQERRKPAAIMGAEGFKKRGVWRIKDCPRTSGGALDRILRRILRFAK
ncbi:hypothetical protein M2368_002876 [Arthrobacter sp. JUb119]|nr:hypothetical protein [Arthrobacter sp. JUb119]